MQTRPPYYFVYTWATHAFYKASPELLMQPTERQTHTCIRRQSLLSWRYIPVACNAIYVGTAVLDNLLDCLPVSVS